MYFIQNIPYSLHCSLLAQWCVPKELLDLYCPWDFQKLSDDDAYWNRRCKGKQIDDNFYSLRLFQNTILSPLFHKNIGTAWFSISVSSLWGSIRKKELSDLLSFALRLLKKDYIWTSFSITIFKNFCSDLILMKLFTTGKDLNFQTKSWEELDRRLNWWKNLFICVCCHWNICTG